MSEFPNEVIDVADMPRDVPVLGAEPIVAKPKRKRRKKVAPKVRTPKVKPVDPILEASKASATLSPDAADAQPIEEAPASSIVQGVGAIFEEAREDRFKKMFREPVSITAPPIKSTWAERFVFGLRRMTGFDPDVPPVRFSTTLTIIFCFAIVGAAAGVARAVL